jgi:RNA polymerase sigma factor (sigma-70 family)
MATGQMATVVRHLRRAAQLREAAALTDGQLLQSFAGRRDEAAFETLLHRHGPLVLGVCRRVLGNSHDAEDAFQATFLVLVRKAASLLPRDTVGNWLYGVAYHTALKARDAVYRRRTKERRVAAMPRSGPADNTWLELQPVLDQELSRLPDKYREPIVLCDLEGKTRKQAARQLGWPEGTVAARIARGRALLGRRLTRRGITLSLGTLAVLVSENAATAGMPAPLMATTIEAANVFAAGQTGGLGVISTEVAALTRGVLKAMCLSRLKTVVLILLVGGLLPAACGLWCYGTLASGPGVAQGQVQSGAPAQDEPAKTVFAPMTATIIGFPENVKPGGKVAKNQELVYLYSADLHKEVVDLVAGIASEKKLMDTLKSRLQQATRAADKNDITSELKKTKASLQAKADILNGLRERINADTARPGNFSVRSPIDGVVLTTDFRDKIGLTIKETQPIMLIKREQEQIDKEAEAAAQREVERLQAQLKREEKLRDEGAIAFNVVEETRLQTLFAQVALARAQKKTGAAIERLQMAIKVREDQAARIQRLVKEGVVAESQLEEATVALAEARILEGLYTILKMREDSWSRSKKLYEDGAMSAAVFAESRAQLEQIRERIQSSGKKKH